MEDNFTPELIEKAKQAKSHEELIALAKENGIELSEDKAKEYFERLNRSGELSDEELDNVSGGGCDVKTGGKKYTVVTKFCKCFTGKYEYNSRADGGYRRNDNKALRKLWMPAKGVGGEVCGKCIHLAFKSGTGYCDQSGR